MKTKLPAQLGRALYAALLGALAGCAPAPDSGYQGYLEADYVYVGSPVAGRLIEVSVGRGDAVTAGDTLYALDPELEQQQLAEAQNRWLQAQAQRSDLSVGRRPEEIRVISERVREARSALTLAEAELKRTRELNARGLVSTDALDRSQSGAAQARARVSSVLAEQSSANLAGRPDALAAADAGVAAAAAVVAQARWRVEQMHPRASAPARVEDTLYQAGEWVPAGSPVLKLLPQAGPFARFFVPLQELSTWAPGQSVLVDCSGCAATTSAKVVYIAAAPEYTPPVIFSGARSEDLVYRVEAQFETPVALAPGLPVVVRRADAVHP